MYDDLGVAVLVGVEEDLEEVDRGNRHDREATLILRLQIELAEPRQLGVGVPVG
jgi:hypothetical protein